VGFKPRLKTYMIKAVREAKIHTRWISPNHNYEEALLAFVDAILEPGADNPFLQDFRQFQGLVAYYGALNSLSQVVLKIAAPGVPDFYQGTEIWDFSLVDPDNRRPVDYGKRIALLKELKLKEARSPVKLFARLLSQWQDGAIKLFVTSRALKFRRTQPQLFLEGDYLPLMSRGPRRRQIVAFARRWNESWILAVVPRLLSQMAAPGHPPLGPSVWGEEKLLLPPGAPKVWEDVFCRTLLRISPRGPDPALPLAEVFQHLPVALLTGVGSSDELTQKP
jgi:(1->4)-alpha-D-glucan 1-alpha-D-glucosylmutase